MWSIAGSIGSHCYDEISKYSSELRASLRQKEGSMTSSSWIAGYLLAKSDPNPMAAFRDSLTFDFK